ncbi:MAG: flagellar hook capping FlgD N-terminal domain-containing protein [Stellaceae bacterium]
MTVSATNPNAPNPISAQPSSASGSGGTPNSALNFTSNFNTFLTLLTTQLQNQDPLSPMDSSTFTQQLVSFSEVEQQIDTNNNLQSLISLQTAGQTIASLPLVGDQIEYNSATAPLSNGSAAFSYDLPSNAASNALVVTDGGGNVVYASTGALSAGQHSFVWNGENNAGQTMPDGAYTLQVLAQDAASKSIATTVQSFGNVSSVAVSNGTATFNVGGISVPMSELITINPTNRTTSSN